GLAEGPAQAGIGLGWAPIDVARPACRAPADYKPFSAIGLPGGMTSCGPMPAATRGVFPMLNRRQFLAGSGWAGVSLALSGLLAASGGPQAAEPSLDADAFHGLRRYLRTTFGDIAYVEQGQGDAAL